MLHQGQTSPRERTWGGGRCSGRSCCVCSRERPRGDVGAPREYVCAALLIRVCVYACLNQTRWKEFWLGSHPAWFQMLVLLFQSEHELGVFFRAVLSYDFGNCLSSPAPTSLTSPWPGRKNVPLSPGSLPRLVFHGEQRFPRGVLQAPQKGSAAPPLRYPRGIPGGWPPLPPPLPGRQVGLPPRLWRSPETVTGWARISS